MNGPEDVLRASDDLAAVGMPPSVRLWAMIETPRAILDVEKIAGAVEAAAPPRDADARAKRHRQIDARPADQGRPGLLAWLSAAVLAARVHGIDIIDGIYNDFNDEAGLRAEAEQGRDLGMDGKMLIHPGQIGPVNEIFAPSPAEVEFARKILAAFDLPENRDRGVVQIEGRMVERLHLDEARRALAIVGERNA